VSEILFDAESGRLRLDRPAFDALIDWAADRRAGGVAELRAAGVVDDDGACAPAISAGVDAVVAPICRLVLRIQNPAGRQEQHEGWISGAVAAFLLATEGALCELVNVHPSFLPEAVARVVGLGPRPRLTGTVPVLLDVPTMDALAGPDHERRAAATDQLLATATRAEEQATARALGGGILCRWEAVMTWDPARDSQGRQAMHVVDTPSGMWLLEPAGDRLLASPTTPTVVWRLLIGLLPRDRELDPRHRPGAGGGLDLN
jgi:hypothetical protein